MLTSPAQKHKARAGQRTADILKVQVVELASDEELVSFRSFLVCTLRCTISMCGLYHTVLSRVTPRYTAIVQ